MLLATIILALRKQRQGDEFEGQSEPQKETLFQKPQGWRCNSGRMLT